MSQHSNSNDTAARDTSHAVQLFQDAHQKMVMLKRVEEQMAQLVQRKSSLMDELRSVQGQINDEFDKMFQNGQDVPARLKGFAAAASTQVPREAAFADDSLLTDDEAVA
jgi:hypothetical protein